MNVVHQAREEAVVVATVLVGLARKGLNVPDQVKNRFRGNIQEFETKIVPRLSKGNQKLWGATFLGR